MIASPRHAMAGRTTPVEERRPSAQTKRRDIQSLRALAVSVVVLNHLWPHRLSGGYVGVDVFFVISGFLITTHLNKELVATGSLRIGRFYARRILRLLPAAFLVIATSAIGVWAFLPYSQWAQNAREFVASAFYVENWVLAVRAVDYSAQTEAATVVQHYWSLSVEEQFYLVWPLLLLGLTLLGRRYFARNPAPVVAGALAVVGIAFFVASIAVTATSPNEAYFVTPVRVWEFALGGVTALLAPTARLGQGLANVVAVGGFAAILGASTTFGPQTPFPGWLALIPALGTACVILAGTGRGALFHDVVTGARPIQFIGDISYSIYLWHWPLVVLVPFAVNHPLDTATKAVIAIAAVTLAWATKVFVEDQGRQWRWARAQSWRPFAAMGVGIVLTAVLSGTLLLQANAKAEASARLATLAASEECAGPRALHNSRCPAPFAQPVTDPVMGDVNRFAIADPLCDAPGERLQIGKYRTTRVCDFSGGNPHAPNVWLVGDSHAAQWARAVQPIAAANGWRLTSGSLGGCPPASVSYVGFDGGTASPEEVENCEAWNRGFSEEILRERPDLVLTTAYARRETVDDGTGRSQQAQMIDGLHRQWQAWIDAGINVAVVADPPLNNLVRDPHCLLANAAKPLACAVDRKVAQPPDPLILAARSLNGVGVVDLTDDFCDQTHCYAAVGGTSIYFDDYHLNGIFAELISPYFADALRAVDPSMVSH